MDTASKIVQMVSCGAAVAALEIGLCNSGSTSRSGAGETPQFVTKSVTLDTVVVALTDPYFCYVDDIKDQATKELASLADEQGAPVFSCEELFAYKNAGGDAAFAQELLSLKNHSGHSTFTGADLFAYKIAGGTIEYARKFLTVMDKEGKNIFYGAQLAQLYRLGLDVPEILEFHDTAKPNGLVTFPTKDNNPDAYGHYLDGTFRGDDTLTFFRELKQWYDLRVVIASREEEIYAALDASAGFESYTGAGHGSQTELGLGEIDLGERYSEVFSLDISDTELGPHLQNLSPHAVIFLYSCSTAKGGKDAENLVNKVAQWAHGRKVIGATEILNTFRVKVDSYYPFEATLMDFTGERDITYRVVSPMPNP